MLSRFAFKLNFSVHCTLNVHNLKTVPFVKLYCSGTVIWNLHLNDRNYPLPIIPQIHFNHANKTNKRDVNSMPLSVVTVEMYCSRLHQPEQDITLDNQSYVTVKLEMMCPHLHLQLFFQTKVLIVGLRK